MNEPLAQRTPRVHPRHPDALGSIAQSGSHRTSAKRPGQKSGHTLRLAKAQKILTGYLAYPLTPEDTVHILIEHGCRFTKKQGTPAVRFAAIDNEYPEIPFSLGVAAIDFEGIDALCRRIDLDRDFADSIVEDLR